MPAFGVKEVPGIGAIFPATQETLERHRSMERRKMSRPRQPGVERASKELEAYIYNVGPFTRKMDTLGSIGVMIIPGLVEKDVLVGLSVAGPLVVPGLPAEPYPGEPRNQWIDHEPKDQLAWIDADGEVFQLRDRPGIDLGLRIIGGHEQSPNPIYSASPYQQGCFVSTIPAQKEPKEPKEPGDKATRVAVREYEKLMLQFEEDFRLWLKWEASVKAAQDRFARWAARRGEEQCLAFQNGTYIRDEELFVLARIFKKTDRDWNFLSGTAENTVKRKCWNCKFVIDGDALTCGHCKERQVSQEEYDKRRQQMTAA